MRTVKYSQATQPYEVNCLGLSEIISAHNGYVKNYMSIKNGFKENHQFESKKVGFVDSEVIPHLFEESLMQHNDGIEARKEIFETIKGDNTIILLFTTKSSRFLHVLHKGQTRGMYVWKNNKGEIILCSREAPLLQVFEDFLEKSNFNRVLSINRLVDTEEQQTYEIRGL